MNYQRARASIKSGDVIAWRGTGAVSEFIRRVTGGDYSHVAIAWWSHQHLWVIQSQGGHETGIFCLSKLVRDHAQLDWIATGLGWSAAIEAKALDLLDKDYSWLACAAVGLGLTPPAGGASVLAALCRGARCRRPETGAPRHDPGNAGLGPA
ncbi:MAG: hypothetical protein KGQ37_01415 [Hyphomicrobiales bacterium]|nr:hypothetical protein [Hyphomicrobiales bacterium]